MYYIIDRIEGNFAVCENSENGKMENILINELPTDIQEGNIIRWDGTKYIRDIEAEKERKNSLKEKIKRAWNK